MTEQKKKTRSKQKAALKAQDMRTYQADTSTALSAGLGMPPLKMILVHAENDRANAADEPAIRAKRLQSLTQEETVLKIIEHLKSQ